MHSELCGDCRRASVSQILPSFIKEKVLGKQILNRVSKSFATITVEEKVYAKISVEKHVGPMLGNIQLTKPVKRASIKGLKQPKSKP
jgi:hypothetical protein